MRTRKRKKKLKSTSILLTVVIVIIALVFINNNMDIISVKLNELKYGTLNLSSLSTDEIQTEKLYSENVILVDLNTGKTLYEKNSQERAYPASLTKIMTVLIAIEQNDDFQRTVLVSNNAVVKSARENASVAGYRKGERTSINDLLYGCLLASGADASITLAEATAGSEAKFVKLMNHKAEKLNMKNTNFTNVTGLHSERHYSTANDMNVLLGYALDNDKFREVFTSQSSNVVTDSREFTVQSTFFSEFADYLDDLNGFKVEGAKTGTTKKAGLCLASLAAKSGHELVLVTMGAPIGGNPKSFSYDDLEYICKTI